MIDKDKELVSYGQLIDRFGGINDKLNAKYGEQQSLWGRIEMLRPEAGERSDEFRKAQDKSNMIARETCELKAERDNVILEMERVRVHLASAGVCLPPALLPV